MLRSRAYDLMIVPVGGGTSRSYRLSRAALRLIAAGLLGVVGLAVFIVSYYGSLVIAAARAESIASANRKLEQYNLRVRALEAELRRYEEMTDQIARMAGLEKEHELIREEMERREHIREEELRRAGITSADTGIAVVSAPVDEEQAELRRYMEQRAASLRAIPAGWPVRGYVSRGFGAMDLLEAEHTGTDVACAEGTPVKATASGRVANAGWDEYLGWTVTIDHGNGFQTVYGHLSRFSVSQGDVVEKGRVIGASGNTGRSSAPHLHYEVIRDGVPVDPARYMR